MRPTRGGAHDQDRTGDLVLTKDALYRLSYVGVELVRLILVVIERSAAPTVLRGSPSGAGDGIRTRDIQLGRLELYQLSYTRPVPASLQLGDAASRPSGPPSLRGSEPRSARRPLPLMFRAPVGGEGRIRTFEARGASDLQSDAFGRFATSPPHLPSRSGSSRASPCRSDCRRDERRWCLARDRRAADRRARRVELAEGIEPPTR